MEDKHMKKDVNGVAQRMEVERDGTGEEKVSKKDALLMHRHDGQGGGTGSVDRPSFRTVGLAVQAMNRLKHSVSNIGGKHWL